MSAKNYGKKRDGNEAKIVEALADDVMVVKLNDKDIPDLLIGYRGINYLVEIKNLDTYGKLTEDQATWHDKWVGQCAVAYTYEDVISIIGYQEKEDTMTPQLEVVKRTPALDSRLTALKARKEAISEDVSVLTPEPAIKSFRLDSWVMVTGMGQRPYQIKKLMPRYVVLDTSPLIDIDMTLCQPYDKLTPVAAPAWAAKDTRPNSKAWKAEHLKGFVKKIAIAKKQAALHTASKDTKGKAAA